MSDEVREDDGLEGRVLALAGGGLSWVEIAAALGFSEAELTVLEGARPALALAVQWAEMLERALLGEGATIWAPLLSAISGDVTDEGKGRATKNTESTEMGWVG